MHSSNPFNYTIIILALILSACSSMPSYIQTDIVPAESLRVAQILDIAKRQDIIKLEAYKSIIATGTPDSEVVDGSLAAARVYCCGGISQEFSSERVYKIFLFVPKGLKIEVGDFVEVKVARSPTKGDNGSLNTVTRLAYRYPEKPQSCWWDPKDDRLWLRTIYCEWMPKEGWIKQEGLYPSWFKPPY